MQLNWLDFNYVHFLDALAEEYRAQGYLVHFQPFTYGADFLPLTLLTTQSVTTVIDHDADFVLCFQNFAATVAATNANLAAPNSLAQQILETSGRRLQDRPTHILNIFGTGQRPAVLFKPIVIPARSTISLELQDLGGITLDIRISYVGCKAYVSPLDGPPGGERATGRSRGPTILGAR